MYWTNVVIPISYDVFSCGHFTQHIFIFVTVKIALLSLCHVYLFISLTTYLECLDQPIFSMPSSEEKATKELYSDLCEYPQNKVVREVDQIITQFAWRVKKVKCKNLI